MKLWGMIRNSVLWLFSTTGPTIVVQIAKECEENLQWVCTWYNLTPECGARAEWRQAAEKNDSISHSFLSTYTILSSKRRKIYLCSSPVVLESNRLLALDALKRGPLTGLACCGSHPPTQDTNWPHQQGCALSLLILSHASSQSSALIDGVLSFLYVSVKKVNTGSIDIYMKKIFGDWTYGLWVISKSLRGFMCTKWTVCTGWAIWGILYNFNPHSQQGCS